MHKCLLLKHIWKDSEKTQEGAVLIKEINLNFIPFENLSLDGGSAYASVGRITSVTYVLSESQFRLELSDASPWWSELYGKTLKYDDLLKFYKEDGWKEYLEFYANKNEGVHAAN